MLGGMARAQQGFLASGTSLAPKAVGISWAMARIYDAVSLATEQSSPPLLKLPIESNRHLFLSKVENHLMRVLDLLILR